MKTYLKELRVTTKRKMEVLKITEQVNQVIKESGINDGIVTIYVPHATATVIVNEFEPRIINDYVEWIRRNIPADAGWEHDEIDNNAYAHIASAILGPGKVIPLHKGRLMLGTWQEIMLLELDGPRNFRTVVVQIIGS
ncbi:MAG: secondary thiamine-phosphate synthase enzyme YjbQ [Sulfolobales archaeon]|nr:secondary thiamine-phosphate synthase enzyme YjbQ [Sulfolobales archaeon]MCX8185936.1 secondary thiamine-phosphate synthase enzyme YjbQ [Sulfolobales archaeon]MDW7969193.1 secondary thiamine-phosphate synthase enzyme YjbQ [Sulfolobales archaeon]